MCPNTKQAQQSFQKHDIKSTQRKQQHEIFILFFDFSIFFFKKKVHIFCFIRYDTTVRCLSHKKSFLFLKKTHKRILLKQILILNDIILIKSITQHLLLLLLFAMNK